LGFVGKPLDQVTLDDVQAFADSLTGLDSSRARVLAVVKSLLSFAAKTGLTQFNVGAALRKPKFRETLAERILDEAAVIRMVALAQGRDHALVRLMYASGFRVSEVVSLRWVDVAAANDGSAFLTVFGKGGKTRTVRVSAATAGILRELRGDARDDSFVFPGRKGHALNTSQAWRIVRKAAQAAGIDRPVSPHFLRHAHASHALDKGARLTTVRDTLGHSSIATTNRYAHARPDESSGMSLAV
jgi:integrase/recombinase XerD